MHIYPGCVYTITAMPGIRSLQGILPPRGGRAQSLAKHILRGTDTSGSISTSSRNREPAVPSTLLCHTKPASRIRASKWRVRSYSCSGRRAHLQKYCTKGLKTCLQFSWLFLLILRNRTKWSGQRGSFFAFFMAFIYNLSDDPKIAFMGTKGSSILSGTKITIIISF